MSKKGTLHLSIDSILVDRAKIAGINISELVEDVLRYRLQMTENINETEPLDKQVARIEVEASEKQRALAALYARKEEIKKKEEKRAKRIIPLD